MKNLSLYLNVVIIIGLGLLYYLHFSSDNTSSSVKVVNAAGMIGSQENVVVYVDFDTLLFNYNYYTDLKNELLTKREKSEAELNIKFKAFDKEAGDFKNKLAKQLITRADAQVKEEELLLKRNNLFQLRDNLSRELLEEEQVMNRQLQYSVIEFLKGHCKDKNYNYILSNTFGGALLYSNRGLNVTKEVIEGINENYSSTKAE